jgi:hypothetical protein
VIEVEAVNERDRLETGEKDKCPTVLESHDADDLGARTSRRNRCSRTGSEQTSNSRETEQSNTKARAKAGELCVSRRQTGK